MENSVNFRAAKIATRHQKAHAKYKQRMRRARRVHNKYAPKQTPQCSISRIRF